MHPQRPPARCSNDSMSHMTAQHSCTSFPIPEARVSKVAIEISYGPIGEDIVDAGLGWRSSVASDQSFRSATARQAHEFRERQPTRRPVSDAGYRRAIARMPAPRAIRITRNERPVTYREGRSQTRCVATLFVQRDNAYRTAERDEARGVGGRSVANDGGAAHAQLPN